MPTKTTEICHINVPAPDLAKAKAFYTKAFGWKYTPMRGMDRYAFWSAGDMSGGFDADAKPSKSGVTLYLAVADIPAALKKVERAGGKAVRPKTEIPGGMGFLATFDDSNGNRMGLWSKK